MLTKRMPEPIPQNFKTIKVGQKHTAIIDPEDEAEISKHSWFIKSCHGCLYAARVHESPGRKTIIYMHRQIANAPRGFVVHHKNGKTLDNRKSNLQCCSKDAHRQYHLYGTSIPNIDLKPYRQRDAKKCLSSKIA